MSHLVEQIQSVKRFIKYEFFFGCEYLYLVFEKNVEAKTKCHYKHTKNDQTFQESVEDIMENSDILSNNRHLPQVYKKIYPCKG